MPYKCPPVIRTRIVGMLLTLLLGSSTLPLCAQTELKSLREVKLPVPLLRGTWWSPSIQSRWLFSIRVTPNNELLVFEPDKNGNWPLVKVTNWWAKDSKSTKLAVPGWSGKDDENLERLGTDLQITPDDKYAVTFAFAEWHKSSSGATRGPDAIVSVIDLSRWQIVASLHTSELGFGLMGGGWITNTSAMVLMSDQSTSSEWRTSYALVSLPTLSPGLRCTTHLPVLPPSELQKDEPKRRKRDNEACADILEQSGLSSVEELKSLTTTGRKSVPEVLKGSAYRSQFVSESGVSYGLDSVNSELSAWKPDGESLRKQKCPHLLCEGQPVQGPSWICDCDIVDLTRNGEDLLTHYIIKHDNLFGWQVWLRQWLSVFRADNLSEIAFIRLSGRNEETKAVLASADGQFYVLAISLGDTLRVFKVPDR